MMHTKAILRTIALSLLLAGSAVGSAQAAGSTRIDGKATQLKRTAASQTGFDGNGWYWNPAEAGTGFLFEAQGNNGFAGFFMYDESSGKPVWYVVSGPFTANGNGGYGFSGTLQRYQGGQPASSTQYTSPTATSVGNVQITFSAANQAHVQFPGRTMEAVRFNFSDLSKPAGASQPEVGWFWNPAEGGRGYAVEVQNNRVFMAMFHYNSDGSPTWNVVQGDIGSGTLSSSFDTYSGGQSLSGNYRTPTLPVSQGQYVMRFGDPCVGQVQYGNVPTVAVQRFAFGGLPAGYECRARANAVSASIPGRYTGTFSGSELGTFDVNIDTLGRVTGGGYSNTFQLRFGTVGQVTPDGRLSLTATASGVAGASNYTGTIGATCTINGTWAYTMMSGGGQFAGAKSGTCP
ncbi:hypothetical protein FNU76_19755 [Chitinimonas arctica]|uniref:Uncharacterized protein n=1 Tax=Chitinimonas arctica TaxID=2594795 RepID=A0A516SJT9_9NEIS|nr:hypothetical protein [Chitinimonas arctica]QDQ28410.1 hypothetical protein FNU76_19755 [Chitinimonas arctica]